MQHKLYFVISIFFLSFALSSCRPTSPTVEATETTPSSGAIAENLPYPSPSPFAFESAYPSPQDPVTDTFHPDSVVVPAPGTDTGVITGKLVFADSKEPYLNSVLILGEVTNPDTEGYPPLIGFSAESDPQAVQAKDGVFVFDKVTPGMYGIVLWSPLSTFLLSELDTDNTIFITVNAGETTDLGTLYIK